MLKREAMKRDIESNLLELFEEQKNEILQRKQQEKEVFIVVIIIMSMLEMHCGIYTQALSRDKIYCTLTFLKAILRARQDFEEQKRLEEEQRARALARKAARRAYVAKKLEQLEKEIKEKKALFDYEEAVMEEMNHVIDMWDEVDYAYIEMYLGKEYRDKIVALDKARKRREAFKNVQRLIEIFDLKREELLLKLEQARELFYESLEEQSFYFDYQEMLTRAFVFSYFQYIPTDDDKMGQDMMEQIIDIL